MRLFHWTAHNDVFVEALDDEHRTIFEVTGELQQALRRRAPLFEIQETLHRLVSNAEDHFATEEKLMREANYLSLNWHKGQHDTARKRFREYVPLIEKGDFEAGHALIDFLTQWLDDHTAVTDRMMAAHLRNHRRAGTR
jgi:hemerythrin